jgi:hypothetical protein
MEGGKKKRKVHYRGDLKQERIWTVKNEGNNLVTIETEDRDYLKAADCIKVVRPEEIYNFGEYDYYEQSNAIQQQQEQQQQQVYETAPRFGQQEDPRNIIIAPVIKVFSGDGSKDMSQTRQNESEGNYIESDELQMAPVDAPDSSPPELDFSKPLIIEKAKN